VITVGLTGGIGSGKTTVARRLEALGAAVVDTDEVSRRLTGPGGAAVERLREAFGERFVGSDGALERSAMRELVFEDAEARARLESILHPAIREATDRALAEARGPYALVVVPLLFETRGYLDRVLRTLVVDCAEALQVERTARRSQLSAEAVRAIMAAQWPRWRRLQVADDVVWNGGEEAGLAAQCERLHRAYCSMDRGRIVNAGPLPHNPGQPRTGP
jgi:dephospho-CoA kinase